MVRGECGVARAIDFARGDVGQFAHWAATASPQARFAYHEGSSLPRRSPAVALARELYDDGEVLLSQAPRPGGGRLYLAIKRAVPQPPLDGFGHDGAAARRARAEQAIIRRARFAVAQDGLGDKARRMLATLREAARLGIACPSNTDLAWHIDLARAKDAGRLVRQLVDAGLIGLGRGPCGGRVITDALTGRATLPAAGTRDAG